MKEKRLYTNVLRLECDVLHFLRSYYAKNKTPFLERRNQVRKPTAKEMAKHTKLLRKQRARFAGV
jgi:hypothetical protein